MAFDDILHKIREDGAAAVAAVQAESDAAIADMRRAAEREADTLRESLHQRAQRRATEHGERLRTLAQLEHRKAVLAEKQRAIQRAFARAEERLAALPPHEIANLARRLITERVESGREEIVPGRADAAAIDSAFLAELNAALGDRGHLTLAAAPGDFEHGVVLREGRKEINVRLSVVLAETRERLVHSIAEQLFAGATA